MVKIVIEIEEKERVNYKSVSALGLNCNINKIIDKFSTKGEKQASEEIIKKLIEDGKTQIINKYSEKNKYANELVEILESWNL